MCSSDLLIPQFSRITQHIKGFKCGGANGRSYRIGEQVRAAALTEKVCNLPTRRRISAARAAESLSESAGYYVDSALYSAKLRRSSALITHKAYGV